MHNEASFDDGSISEGAQNVVSAIYNDEANEKSQCLTYDYYGGYSQQETQTGRYDDISSRQRKEKARRVLLEEQI